MRDGTALEILKKLKPDVIVVQAYGQDLPKNLELPAYGCINVHASLLPRYRGAGPVQWSVINGEKITGVTTMFMGEGLDTGDILEQTQTAIGSEETAGELMDRLADLGAQLLLHTLTLLESGKRFVRYRTRRWLPMHLCSRSLMVNWIFPSRHKNCTTGFAACLPGRPHTVIWTESG